MVHVVRNRTMVQIIESAKEHGFKAGCEWSSMLTKVTINSEQTQIRELKRKLNTVYGNIATGVYSTPASAYCVNLTCGPGGIDKFVITSDESLATCVELVVKYARNSECPDCVFTVEPF